MSELPVFVYGTLKRGESNHAAFLADAASIEPATVRGAIVHLPAGYPGYRLEPEGTVHGELVSFDADRAATALARLDALEDYRADAPHASLYRRERCTATTPAGRAIDAWIYVYAAPLPADAIAVPSGRWRGSAFR